MDKRIERRRATKFWESLERHQKALLMDDLILGTFDWTEWFETKPSKAQLDQIDYLAGLEQS